LASADQNIRKAGFKFGNTHVLKYPGLIGYLGEQKYDIIHLSRENRIEQYISMCLAFANDSWRSDSGPWKTRTLTVDLDHMDDYLGRFERHDRLIKEYFANFNRLELSYEALLTRGFSRVLEFLGLPPAELSSPFKRQGGGRLAETILNYDEVARRLRGGPYEVCLTEGANRSRLDHWGGTPP